MRIIADFLLDSDLCLSAGEPPLVVDGPARRSSLTIQNSQEGQASSEGVLSAQLVFEAPSLEGARDIAEDELAIILNALTFATNQRISQGRFIRLVDWTPGLRKRDAFFYAEVKQGEHPAPDFDGALATSATRLVEMMSEPHLQGALRWYRLGIGAESIEEQFSYFWRAVEIISEMRKGTEKTHIGCPHCNSGLFCEKCGKHPERRKVSAEAIRQTISEVAPKGADVEELYGTLSKIRNTLMHGRRIASIADTLPCTKDQAVTVLAKIAWRSMSLLWDQATEHG